MIKPELYQRTVDILVEAYFNDTLQHEDCSACAVGNIAAGNGVPVYEDGNMVSAYYNNAAWKHVFITSGKRQEIDKSQYKSNIHARRCIDATGYTLDELAKIEFAFETAPYGKDDDEWMFNGLMAVIDVLDEIHQNTDTETTNATKQRFICQH